MNQVAVDRHNLLCEMEFVLAQVRGADTLLQKLAEFWDERTVHEIHNRLQDALRSAGRVHLALKGAYNFSDRVT